MIKYFKSAARLSDRVLVNKRGLDLSKEVLWVSVGQRAAELRAVKVGGQKKFADWPGEGFSHSGVSLGEVSADAMGIACAGASTYLSCVVGT